MATLKEVADRAGVTITTVSRMLNKPEKVSKKTSDRIRRAMKELNYKPNEIAQSLSKRTSNMIGLIVPSARNYFFCKIIDSIEHYTAINGYKLLLCASNHEREKEIEYFSMLKANKVAGVIIASRTQDIGESVQMDAPIISIDRMISPVIPSVCSDNFTGGCLAARHLIDKGCKKPAYFSGSPTLVGMDANKRLQGFESVLREHSMHPVVLELSEDRFVSMKYEDVIAAFFEEHGDVDGVFTSNDIIAAEIIRYCGQKGIEIPGKLKVVGYDDIDLAGLFMPSITTIRQPIDDMCRYAVESIIGYKDRAMPIATTFPVRLIEREST
ncbi:MAG: LacI family transcriptional regulator [Clostridiales bacterium]|nr:LacI family transcriptional regulator [Clostridiales bacterium]